MIRITTRAELRELHAELGLRSDWHEPDERDVTAEVRGVSFDNAGFWPAEDRPFTAPEIIEQHVVLSRAGEPVAVVNLATLFAWATQDVRDVVRRALQQYEDEIALSDGSRALAAAASAIVAEGRRRTLDALS